MTKKIAIFSSNLWHEGQPLRNDQYDTFRSEGRYPMNIGFGLALLGFDVNIICEYWNIPISKKAEIPKTEYYVTLSNRALYNYYDYILLFSQAYKVKALNYGKLIYMGYEICHSDEAYVFSRESNNEVIYVCPFPHMINEKGGAQDHSKLKVHYLPGLYPIPSINIGYLPFKFEPKNNEINLYIYFSSWKNSTYSNLKYLRKQQLIIDFLNSKGYKVKAYIHIESEELIDKCSLKADEVIYFYNNKNLYIDVINLLKSSDICITFGGFNAGNCLPDIISLGKSLIYIADESPRAGMPIPVNLYQTPNHLIYLQESNDLTITKLNHIFSNMKEVNDSFRSAYKDSDFNNWKEIAKQFFIT